MQVVLSFYEKRVRQQWGLAFGKQEERLFWEQWCARHVGFSFRVLGAVVRAHSQAALQLLNSSCD